MRTTLQSFGVALGVMSAACGPMVVPTDSGPADAGERMDDAFRPPVQRLYLNPAPPLCLDALEPPRWRVATDPGPEGTVLWTRSIREPEFERWLEVSQVEGPFQPWYDTGPSLSGDGIATWFFTNGDDTWALGIGPLGAYSNSGLFDSSGLPRVWLPRSNLLHDALASLARPMYAPQPPTYSPEPRPEPWVAAVGRQFWPDGAVVGGAGDMIAWSSTTGDFITFGGLANGREQYRGVGAGCTEGVRWFTQLPIYEGQTRAFVRANGDAVVSVNGEIWVLGGTTGELLRGRRFDDEDGIPGRPAAYHPGCGLLVEYRPTQTWRWLNDETMELGPLLSFPEELPSSASWSGTSDCGLLAIGGTRFVSRVDANGTLRFSTRYGEDAEFVSSTGPPIPLADGGALVVLNPPGWLRVDAVGEVVSRQVLDPVIVGEQMANEPTLAPDGTLYFLTRSSVEGLQFVAVSTDTSPGPFLWRESGSNWARTNSTLPE